MAPTVNTSNSIFQPWKMSPRNSSESNKTDLLTPDSSTDSTPTALNQSAVDSNTVDTTWIVEDNDAKRIRMDRLCFCDTVRVEEHMVSCHNMEKCVSRSNWFHASCVGLNQERLLQALLNSERFFCIPCIRSK